MVKTLKVAKILIAICVVGIIVFLIGQSFRGDSEFSEFINSPGAIEVSSEAVPPR